MSYVLLRQIGEDPWEVVQHCKSHADAEKAGRERFGVRSTQWSRDYKNGGWYDVTNNGMVRMMDENEADRFLNPPGQAPLAQ